MFIQDLEFCNFDGKLIYIFIYTLNNVRGNILMNFLYESTQDIFVEIRYM